MMTGTLVMKDSTCDTRRSSAFRAIAFSKCVATILFITLCSTGELAALSPVDGADAHYTEIVVFGDNMSDTGNRAFVDRDYATDTSQRPYNNGRQSNGLLMVEHLAQARNIPLAASRLENKVNSEAGTNFAVVGARAADVSPPEQKNHQLAKQIEQYRERTPPTGKTLIVIAIGANDVADTVTADIDVAETRREFATNAISDAVNDLIDMGGRRFVVVNVAGLAHTPEMQRLIAAEDNRSDRDVLKERATSDVTKFNEDLVEKTETLVDEFNENTPGDSSNEVVLVTFDLFERVEEVLDPTDDAAQALRETLGIENFQNACFNSVDSTYHEGCDEKDENINKFAFFDHRQSTNSIHKYLADALDKVIPDPACEPEVDCPIPPCEETGTCPQPCEETGTCPPLFSNGSALRMILENPNPNAPKTGNGSGGGTSSGSSDADIVYINGVAGVIRWPAGAVSLDRARNNPAFNPNYLTEQNLYSGPLWYPL